MIRLNLVKVKKFGENILQVSKCCLKIARNVLSALILTFPSLVLANHDTNLTINQERTLARIENLVSQGLTDDLVERIIDEVQGLCIGDYSCKISSYDEVSRLLEEKFYLKQAVKIQLEIVTISKANNDPNAEGRAHWNLYRFFQALGKGALAANHSIQSISLLESAADSSFVNRMRFVQLEDRINESNAQEFMTKLAALTKESEKEKDHVNALYFSNHMCWIILEYGDPEDALQYVENAEAILADKDEMNPRIAGKLIAPAVTRAKIAKANNDYTEAVRWLERAMVLAERAPDFWQVAHICANRAEIELKVGNINEARLYTDRGLELAERLEMFDLIGSLYLSRANVFELEGNFQNAYADIQKHLELADNVGGNDGFDAQNYYLLLEKDQLVLDNQKAKLEISENEIQQRNTLLVIFLMIILGLTSVVAWLTQRSYKRRLMEEKAHILRQTEKLKDLDAAKSRFFANVSHELRTPLTLILGAIAKLESRQGLDDEQSRLLSMAGKSSKELKGLVADILDLQKLEAGELPVDLRKTRVVSFFNALTAQFRSLAGQNSIALNFNSECAEDLIVLLDQNKCRQILNNLLSNAIKYTPQKGTIEINLSVDSGSLFLEVVDSGLGISAADLPHVFDRFFQTTHSEKKAEGGSGIGLALCKEYAHLFGGEIEAESELGEYTKFRVCWPIEVVNATPEELKTSNDFEQVRSKQDLVLNQINGRPTILVVEDHPDLREFICVLLNEHFNVCQAGNGAEAIELLEAKDYKVDLIISDLMMPIMDGYQLLDKLKQNSRSHGIPVIMLTARAEARDRLHALRLGVDDYLLKPFNEEEIIVRINNLLVNRKNREEARVEESEQAPIIQPELNYSDRSWLEKFEKYVLKNLSDDALTIPGLAEEFAMSESTLLRQLKKLTGLTPSMYLKEARFEKARHILESGEAASLQGVASAVGFTDTRSFSRSFKKRYGRSPADLFNEESVLSAANT